MKRFMLISLPLTSLVLLLVGVSLPASAMTSRMTSRLQQGQMRSEQAHLYRLNNHS